MGTTTAPWKQLLLSALDANSHLKHSSFLQLATVGSNDRPANRTVVFRGFQENTEKFQINTDSRTRKIEELKHCPFAEICWYFTDSWEQFRINGRVDVIDGSNPDPAKLQQREKSWFASSVKSRLQYLGPYPGLPSLTEKQSANESSLCILSASFGSRTGKAPAEKSVGIQKESIHKLCMQKQMITLNHSCLLRLIIKRLHKDRLASIKVLFVYLPGLGQDTLAVKCFSYILNYSYESTLGFITISTIESYI